MACKGHAWFFKTRKKTGTLEAVLVGNERIHPAHAPSRSLFYIECRNLHSMPREGKGVVVAVKDQEEEWRLGMLVAVTNESLHFFEWTGVPFWNTSAGAGWAEYEGCFSFKVLLLSDVREFRFLNQTYGRRAGGISLTDGLRNEEDGKLQCSSIGPDLLLPPSVKIPNEYSELSKRFRETRQSPVASQLPHLMKKRSLGVSRKRNKKNCDYPVFAKSTRQTLGHLEVGCILVEDMGAAHRVDVDARHLEEKLIAVPYCCREPVGWFAEVPWCKVEKHILPRSGFITPMMHDLLLRELQSSEIFTKHVDVSEYPNGLRIRVVPEEYFNSKDVGSFRTSCNSPRLVIAKESGEPHVPHVCHVSSQTTTQVVPSHHTGLVVSHWIRSKEANPFDITLEDMSLLEKAYSHGYGSRLTTKVVGFNLYQGLRQKGNRAAPSPVEGPGRSAFSQFYRMAYNPIFQFQAEKITNPLGRAAIHVASILDPVLHSVFPASYANTALRFCSQKIITFGNLGKTLGFCNTRHTDKGDVVKVRDLSNMRQLLEPYLESTDVRIQNSVNYIQRWLDWGPIGISTTCVYQFVGQGESDKVLCFFLLDGLGIAVQLNTHVCHMFFGHVFSHRTALPIIIRAGKVHYRDPNFQVFAWGGDTYETSS
jgi:hypothetical protein